MDNRYGYQTDDSIVALATPLAESAVAMIRTSGPGCISLFEGLFHPFSRLRKATHRSAVFGSLKDPESGEEVDEIVALVYHAPGGYTGEEAVELMCHGSLPGIEMVLKLLTSGGFRSAEPGEFTFRAFMNGKLDLTQAEAVHELVTSRSRASHQLALNRLSGALSKQIDKAKALLVKSAGAIEIQLDYPGDEVDDELFLPDATVREAKEILEKLLSSYETGKLYRDGVRVALCGKTNSGKSSLFNLFLKEDRSIVSDIHGTTRDYLESWISLKGIPVMLYDTAGLRETEDPVEAEGIRRAGQVIDSADYVLYAVDSVAGADDEDLQRIRESGSRCLPVWNKIDLDGKPAPEGWAALSAVTGEGFRDVEQWLLQQFKGRTGAGHDAVIDSERQKTLLEASVAALETVLEAFADEEAGMAVPLDGVAVDLKEALDSLGQLTGEVTTADILEKMFSDFCVGK